MKEASISYLRKSTDEWDENHTLTNMLARYTASELPIHVAVHDFHVQEYAPEYCKIHSHTNEAELNIIFSKEAFRLKLLLDDKETILSENCVVHIPAGILHSANVIEGSGIFVCIRIPETNS